MKKIIEQNKKHIQAVIHKLTGSTNEDLEQEVYIRAWQNLPKYKEEGKFKQWICMITANICRDFFRSKHLKYQIKECFDEQNLEDLKFEKTPECITDEKQHQKIILQAIDMLSKEHKKVIVLFEFEGYSIEEIAIKLNIPIGTVKSRLFNARKILKNKLSFLQGETK